jgi:hypothetical protein
MARCSVCDHAEGLYSATTPFINRQVHSKVRWRNEFNEYQCDDCFNAIQHSYPNDPDEEGEVEHQVYDFEEIETPEGTPPVPEPEV